MLDFLLSCFPEKLGEEVNKYIKNNGNCIEEIRIRIDKNAVISSFLRQTPIDYVCSASDIKNIANALSNYNIYSQKEMITKGYFTAQGGIRVGVCGRYIYEKNNILSIVDVSSLNIRIPFCGSADISDVENIIGMNIPKNILVFGGPGTGKTTLIRTLCREYSTRGMKVSVADEKNEIGCYYDKKYYFDLGQNTDVLSECKKADGMKIAVMTLAPQIIAADEIGGADENKAILEAAKCGVKVIASAHADNMIELKDRNDLKDIIYADLFERYIQLDGRVSRGHIKAIYDKNKKLIYLNEVKANESIVKCADTYIKWTCGS